MSTPNQLPSENGNSTPIGTQTENGQADMSQVRELLFGAQMRDYEHRFAHLDQRITEGFASLRSDLNSRAESLERYFKSELDSIANRLANEQSDRERGSQQFIAQLTQLTDEVKQKVIGLDQQISQAERGLRENMLDESRSLRESMEEKHSEQSSALERHSSRLSESKVDRESLADLLKELALRLTGDFQIPGEINE